MLEKEAIVKKLEKQLEELKDLSSKEGINVKQEIMLLEQKIDKIKMEIWNNLEPWDRVQIARSANRLTALDYIESIFDDFTELHGDRLYGDDGAIVGGIAFLDGRPVTIIAEQKGRNTKENISRNFGMPNPEGYRKALRLMKQAEKFHRPIICFVDTPGAYCGLGAEERGQGEAIAKNLMEMSALKVPILSIVIGEGGSGGALALAVANEVWMLENSIYSILSPEGFATILWKDSKKAEQASKVMKITAEDLQQLGLIEKVIAEPNGGVENDREVVINDLKEKMISFFRQTDQLSVEQITNLRYEKFRKAYN
ncbi:acetyl-coenzyme A carboxylase carboxyl transferase subunit alpha [Anaeromicropila herbilytica]|uniref:Acetyl-coenzyme A carboxylase carboxyl transferase subunit alpha n=1 Tax=Anaeromicropila herbilytica TaxID=2785025 RepID=A0A7R7EHD7_9FIRM|nr:acetyl-CoA carboxylase carboxyltransferase subunit alpha [Anaeromicropila herbilytica]BCN28726.1 acetyl-coenzyme A carboxylase carboxyl transferase subunit alpha [Anaeromicropila herbilytica]